MAALTLPSTLRDTIVPQLQRVLSEFEGVQRVEVLVGGDGSEPLVVAVVVAAPSMSLAALRRWLGANAPELPMPDEFVITSLGLNPLALDDAWASYVKPRNHVERQLVRIWGELLPAPRIGALDDFFALGGHSLLAARMHFAITRQFGVTLEFNELLQTPVLADLAERIARAQVEGLAVNSG